MAHPDSATALTAADTLLALLRDERVDAERVVADVGWASLEALAVREGVAPLLSARLGRDVALAAHVPGEIRARLRRTYERTWARTSALAVRWDDVRTTLERAGIRAIALKGIALVRAIYDDPGLRPMSDIDVLVAAHHLEPARAALLAAGWSDADGADAAGNAYRGFAHLTRGGAVLDLHRDIAGYPRVAGVVRVDHAALLAGAQPLAGGGLQLASEHQLLHLALHLVLGSEFGRLLNFVDVDRVVRSAGAGLAWDAVLDEAARWRIRGVLAYVLRVAVAALATPVPDDVRRRLAPRGAQRLVRHVVDVRRPPKLAGRPSDTRIYLAETLLMDRPRWVARVAMATLFPPAPWLRFHYGTQSAAALWLARTWHPVRVCALAARAALAPRRRLGA